MKSYPKTMAAVLLAAAGSANAASVVVDWLVMRPGGTSAAFALVNDGGTVIANGALALTKGVAFPGLPAARTFAAANWVLTPDLVNTQTTDATLSGTELRVAPSGGLASYVVNFSVPAGQPLIVVVGGLLRNGVFATDAVEIAALSDADTAPVTLRSTNAWSNGLTVLNQGVIWNPLTQVLGTTPGTTGDSVFAFFDVAPLTGANPRLSFSIPSGYATGTGDSIFFGIGTMIPEPATAGLLLLGAGMLAGQRRRSR